MKIFIQLILLLAFSSSVFSADKAPIGSWQLTTTTQMALTTATGKTVKSTPLKGFEFATFQADGSYASSEWLNKIVIKLGGTNPDYPIDFYGQWNSKTSSSYNVSYDKFLLILSDNKFGVTNAAFFERIGFVKFFKDSVGTSTPLSLSLTVISYLDDGSVSALKSLKGTKKMVVRVSWKNGDIPTSTDVTMTETYTGKPFIQSTCCGTDVAQNATDSDKFMADIDKLPDVKTTTSGLKYIVLQDNVGGVTPTAPTDTVTVNYRGFLPSGQKFDSGSSYVFKLKPADVTPGVIAGWVEGLQLMKKGSKYRFFIPSNLAYGQTEKTSIPGNSALVFDVELLSITPETVATAAPAAPVAP
jgi:FKBP-type peptidyl-prolyl cis-trans isomerase